MEGVRDHDGLKRGIETLKRHLSELRLGGATRTSWLPAESSTVIPMKASFDLDEVERRFDTAVKSENVTRFPW